MYQVYPYLVVKKDKSTALGVRLGNAAHSDLFSYLESDKSAFDLKISNQKLFELPIYKKITPNCFYYVELVGLPRATLFLVIFYVCLCPSRVVAFGFP